MGYTFTQTYPNIFNPSTTIEFDLPETNNVNLEVFNVLGEEVVTLVSDRLTAGSYSYDLDASKMPSSVYLYRLSVGSLTTKSGHFVAREAGNPSQCAPKGKAPSGQTGHGFVETRKMAL
jgi:hypothetical protein